MMGKTHIVLGASTALIATQPTTTYGVVVAALGGAFGGWLVDIDQKESVKKRFGKDLDNIINALFIIAFVAVDFLTGEGACQFIIDHWKDPLLPFSFIPAIPRISIIVVLIIAMVYGYNTSHRTFTHSFTAMAIYGVIIYTLCPIIAIPFIAGYASHIVIDLLNKKAEQIFWPADIKVCLNRCSSNGKLNDLLFSLCLILVIQYMTISFIVSIIVMPEDAALMTILNCKLYGFIRVFSVYLVSVNILSFIGFSFSARKHDRKEWEEQYDDNDEKYADVKDDPEDDRYEEIIDEFYTWVLDFLVFIGGGVGMLLALILHGEIPTAYNGNW